MADDDGQGRETTHSIDTGQSSLFAQGRKKLEHMSLFSGWRLYSSPAVRIFVTGGQGFIGSHLVHELVDLGHDLASFDASLNFIDNPAYYQRCVTLRTDYLPNASAMRYVGDIRCLDDLSQAVTEFEPEVGVHPAC